MILQHDSNNQYTACSYSRFYYLNAELNGINESAAGLFRSTSNGATWTNLTEWEDEQGNQAQTGSLDLPGVPAGKYRLKVKDDNNCDILFTPFYSILANGAIIIGSSHLIITASDKCGHYPGEIKGLEVTNGESYTWIIGSDTTIGNTPDITNITPGNYTLTITNHFNCTLTLPYIHVPQKLNKDWETK